MLKPYKNMKRHKAQSAMEYLMTYGWAILIIAVVLGALFSLGVFSGSNILGTACIAGSGYLCQNPTYVHGTAAAGSAAGNIIVTVGQNTGTTWLSANIMFVPLGQPTAAGVPSSISAVGGSAQFTAGAGNVIAGGLTSGQSISVVLPVNGIATGVPVAVGAPATGAVWAVYTTSSGGAYQYAQIASINVKAT